MSFAQRYAAPRWLPGGNLQTIWAATRSRRHLGTPPPLQRERWTTPDGDFIDVDHLRRPDGAAPPVQHLVLFHGLEGSSASAYAQAFASIAQARGWACSVPHFRGCSGEINRAPRAYHSGDFEEIGWILQRLRERSAAPLRVVGVSLGGNALLRWAQEAGESAAATAAAVAAVCAPIDLAAAGRAIDRGFNRQVYARMFLATMKPRALQRLQRHPGLFDRERLLAARTLYEFDNVFTAPVHGFRDTRDYWARASALPHLARIRIPALLLHARNDPFVPAASLPAAGAALGPHVTLWRPAQGGHVGFPQAPWPGHVLAMPAAVVDWLQTAA
ncbi:MAG: alpha/beta fold hydrolase [Burkholderiales bacterium]|nr:alpha/beta fold hydrolase [Burkholderiales bacterium]MDE2567129.1 alpha/beta fold hydrolase [Burkholderiales bacterium]